MTLRSTARALAYLARDFIPALCRLAELQPDDAPTNERCAHQAGLSSPSSTGHDRASSPRESVAAGATSPVWKQRLVDGFPVGLPTFHPATSSAAEPPKLAADDGPGDGPTPQTSPGPTSLHAVATHGGVTQLHRVVDLVNQGHSPDFIKQWCEREIAKRTLGNDPGAVHARMTRDDHE